MKKRWVIVAGLVAAAAAYAIYAKPWQAKMQEVATATLVAGPATQVLALNGRVAARRSVNVRAAVSARAIELHADEGESVKQGDVLVTLDSALVDAQVEEATAALEAQQTREQQAVLTVERARALGANSPRSALEDAELALASAKKETARLEAVRSQIREQASQYQILAPMSGVVLTRNVDQGQLVDTQTELFVIADMDELVVETDIDELYSAHVREGLKALLRPVGTSVPKSGTIIFASPKVDPSTGGRMIKIAFDEKAALPVGLTVNTNVIVKELDGVLTVPRSAIVTERAQSHVLLIIDGVATQRPITFDDWPSERVVVSEGLQAGEIVILNPAAVKPGDKVVAG